MRIQMDTTILALIAIGAFVLFILYFQSSNTNPLDRHIIDLSTEKTNNISQGNLEIKSKTDPIMTWEIQQTASTDSGFGVFNGLGHIIEMQNLRDVKASSKLVFDLPEFNYPIIGIVDRVTKTPKSFSLDGYLDLSAVRCKFQITYEDRLVIGAIEMPREIYEIRQISGRLRVFPRSEIGKLGDDPICVLNN